MSAKPWKERRAIFENRMLWSLVLGIFGRETVHHEWMRLAAAILCIACGAAAAWELADWLRALVLGDGGSGDDGA